jgi:Uma2 family endonuclease
MAQPSRPSFEELYRRIEQLPEGITGEILEPGVLRTMSRPGRPHRRAAQNCYAALLSFDRNVGGSGWWIEQEAEIRFFGDRLAVPDLSGWRVDRVPELPAENPLTVLPDWCCEVVSPSTARDDRLVKLPLYARAGVPWIWLVAPEVQSIEIYQPSAEGLPTLVRSASGDASGPLPPFEHPIALASWWLEPAPSSG